MIRKILKIRDVWRDNGILAVGRAIKNYASKIVFVTKCRIRGMHGIEITIDGVSSRFRGENMTEIRELWYIKNEEEVILQDLLSQLDEDEVFYDIGANIGVYTCLAAARVSSDRVVAMEPFPPNIKTLECNLSMNDVSPTVIKKAASDTDGKIKLDRTPQSNKIDGSPSINSGDSDEGFEVSTQRVDSVANQLGQHPTIVKIDVEGAEGLVLDGMKDILESGKVRIIYCEVHERNAHGNSVSDYGYSSEGIISYIEGFGFAIEDKFGRDGQFHIKAVRQE